MCKRRRDIYLIRLYLPLADNAGAAFPSSVFTAIQKELTQRYGGITSFTRAPADGLWQQEPHAVQHDSLVIFEVIVEEVDKIWWEKYRRQLESTFSQQSLQITAQKIEKL